MDSVQNIHRRAGLLFKLPSMRISIGLLFVASLPVFLVFNITRLANPLTLLTLALFILILLATTLLEQVLLSKNPLCTLRRLSVTSGAANTLWSISLLAGLVDMVATGSATSSYPFAILGFFLASSLKLLVLGSILADRIYIATPLAFVQSVVIGLESLGLEAFTLTLITKPWMYILGSSIFATVFLLLLIVDRHHISAFRPLAILRSFLRAWADGKADELEEFFEVASSDGRATIDTVAFINGTSPPALIVPNVHPGPIHPVGSSNLPFQLFTTLTEKGYSPLVLHGVSGHDLNIPSSLWVKKLLNSIDGRICLEEASTCTPPVRVEVGGATASGIALGESALIFLTLAPKGMEDFPLWVRKSIETTAKRLGFNHTMVVDAHNSQGLVTTDEDGRACVAAAEQLLSNLRSTRQHSFKVGRAHSSELGIKLGLDLGPAGIGLIILEVDSKPYAIVAADANNAAVGLRAAVQQELASMDVSLLELCTSDTHAVVGKTINSYGYHPLGEATNFQELSSLIAKLSRMASNKLVQCSARIETADASIKVVGNQPFNWLSQILDSGLTLGRRALTVTLLLTLLGFALAYLF